MLIAEIRRKLSDLDDLKMTGKDSAKRLQSFLSSQKEDILTADVFGALKYLPRQPYLEQVLRRVAMTNPHSTAFTAHLNELPFSEDDFAFRFWPNYATPAGLDGQRTEPDVEIASPHLRLFVEAKLHSGFGDTQVLRQLLIGIADTRREFFLLLVTKGVRTPRLLFDKQWYPVNEYLQQVAPTLKLSDQQRDTLINAHERILWTNWRTIAAALQQAHRTHPEPDHRLRCADILSDLDELLTLRSLAPFHGFARALPVASPTRPVWFRSAAKQPSDTQTPVPFNWAGNRAVDGEISFRCPVNRPTATLHRHLNWQRPLGSSTAAKQPTSLWKISAPKRPIDFRRIVRDVDVNHPGPLLLRGQHAGL